MIFGGMIGQIATTRIRDDFNSEVHNAVEDPLQRTPRRLPAGRRTERAGPASRPTSCPTTPRCASSTHRQELRTNQRRRELGPAENPGTKAEDGMRVETADPGRRRHDDRLRPVRPQHRARRRHDRPDLAVIVAGILGGTALACLAGVAIAARAMRPIAALTASAKEISETRDPSHHMPRPAGRRRGRRTGRPWSRCCARSTRRAPSASRRCSSSASSSPTPRTSCARR